MDIHDINNLLHTKNRSCKTPANNVKNNAFSEIFKQKLSNINPATQPNFADNRSGVLEHSNMIINLLDDYAKNLTDPGKNLKDIEPIVGSIEKEIAIIVSENDCKYSKDKELQNFLNELAVIANVAVFKFYRGDFA